MLCALGRAAHYRVVGFGTSGVVVVDAQAAGAFDDDLYVDVYLYLYLYVDNDNDNDDVAFDDDLYDDYDRCVAFWSVADAR